ncbi:MAG: VOC family protein [Gemmatimonadaceae bacterium]|nr:VOC family protein [Gemmatimonadaceae bacterium]
MPNLSDSHIGQIAIVCNDVARARDFYRDALGMTHLFDAGPELSFFQSGTTRLMLSRAEGEAAGTSVLYFFVSDIDGVKSELAGKGVAFIDEPHMIAKMPDHELWLVAFRDSEGNMLALMEERR